jgi:hypothetical protein
LFEEGKKVLLYFGTNMEKNKKTGKTKLTEKNNSNILRIGIASDELH